ncbi:MAG: group III truncated hemoglobin [Bacteroidota bacterium]
MKPDIKQRSDIDLLIRSFYDKVKEDDTIGIIFNEIVKMDWEHHIPVIVDFWDTMLLDADNYHSNAMTPHFDINKIFPLKQEHFERWVELFVGTIDNYFEGPVATLAKTRARGIAGIMKIKMDAINK